MAREIGAPEPHIDASDVRAGGGGAGLRQRVEPDVDAEGPEARAREQRQMTPAPRRDVERAPGNAPAMREPREPVRDERRR